MSKISIQEIVDYTIDAFSGVVVDYNWGEKGLFYNPRKILPKGAYILTFKEKDGPKDKASNVDREGVYRLNLGISKDTFLSMFGEIPKRPPAGGIVNTGHDFQKIDQIMPHPVYGWMSWIGVLNPSKQTFEKLKPLIDEGVQLAKLRFKRKIGS